MGKCFLTIAAVSPSHVANKPAVIVVVHDDTAGPKAALWRYCMMSDLVDRVWTLLEHGDCCGRCVVDAGSRCWRSI